MEDETSTEAVAAPKQARGFALLSPERRAEVSSKGGVRAHLAGTGHEWTKAEAKAAGRKGGQAKRRPRAA